VPRVIERVRILVVGGGGREHALAWRLARDPEVEQVWVAPGNDAMLGPIARLDVAESDPAGLIAACRRERVSLVVIGPETPLAAGLADRLLAAGIPTFGPGAAAARIESSKWFAKELMAEAGVPTAHALLFDALPPARAALGDSGPPWVLKVDGLAAGKGVLVTKERDRAERFLEACFTEHRFGPDGRVLIEEYLEGEEVSIMAVCDGERFVVLPAARDYKRAGDGDRGPNTGGMGAFAPAPLEPGLMREIETRILAPVLAALADRGTPYRGTLYAGLMRTPAGARVVEFNCRFGDPETQVVVPLLHGSLTALLRSAAAGRIEIDAVTRAPGAAVAVALVDEGYPDHVRGGGVIEGLERLAPREEIRVFGAALARESGRWTIRGGRAAYVVARADRRERARELAYAAIDTLGGRGWRCRRDIAADASDDLASGPARGAA
jgi:phosphoribosylamine--glycine ligase